MQHNHLSYFLKMSKSPDYEDLPEAVVKRMSVHPKRSPTPARCSTAHFKDMEEDTEAMRARMSATTAAGSGPIAGRSATTLVPKFDRAHRASAPSPDSEIQSRRSTKASRSVLYLPRVFLDEVEPPRSASAWHKSIHAQDPPLPSIGEESTISAALAFGDLCKSGTKDQAGDVKGSSGGVLPSSCGGMKNPAGMSKIPRGAMCPFPEVV